MPSFLKSSTAVLALCAAVLPAAYAVADAAALPGTWQEHKYTFSFLGFTSTYSCDGLADKLRILLLAAGARPDSKAQPGACTAELGRPDKFARAELTFYTLTPAADPAAAPVVQGTWKPVAIATRRPFEVQSGDCELIEQFKSNVLPLFTTRNVDSHTVCVPHQDAGSSIDLRFEAFAAAPVLKPGAAP